MNIVKLTRRLGGPIYVNIDMIVSFEPRRPNNGAILRESGGTAIEVEESTLEIIRMLAVKKLKLSDEERM